MHCVILDWILNLKKKEEKENLSTFLGQLEN